ncbi:hypothetical protein AB1Y20_011482 [Prymnesium parvum]|uniref:Uncharacterized protein n=1 Tax=Prymnesium parvum TaxID=97485 RepID=A0AB34IJ61_PRYPA
MLAALLASAALTLVPPARAAPPSRHTAPFALHPPPPSAPPSRRSAAPRMLLSKLGVGLLGAGGAIAWAAPTTSLPATPPPDETSAAIVRAVGAWVVCLASLMLAGDAGGVAAAASRGLYHAAFTVIALVPAWEYFDRPKGSQIGAAFLFVALGKLIKKGSISPYVSPAIYTLLGALIYFTPKSTAELYKVSKPLSETAYSLLSVYGGMIATCGVYLFCVARSLASQQCFAAAFAANALLAFSWALTKAGSLGAPKVPALLLGALSAGFAALGMS